MLRNIGAAVVGYIVMALVVMITFSGLYLVLGADRAFTPRSYEVSRLWLTLSIVFGAVAAVAGGMACAAIARDWRGILLLVILVLVLGAAVAVGEVTKDPPGPAIERTAAVGNSEAMQKAIQPRWVTFLNPLIGAAGVVMGGLIRRRKRAA